MNFLNQNAVAKIVTLATKGTGKWQSIKLKEACTLTPIAVLQQAFTEAQEILVQNLGTRLAKLRSMGAPEVILENEPRVYDKAKAGTYPHLRTIAIMVERKQAEVIGG